MDAYDQFKENQKKTWSTFGPSELYTGICAANLVAFAQIKSGQKVLDVGGGTGVVSLAAARRGAHVTCSDLTPELLETAKENAAIAGVELDVRQADVEALPFEDASFDAVISQFGHMFAPRADVTTKEMLRVLKPGGTIAFHTWPPELWTGRMFGLVGKNLPKPPVDVSPPPQWGDPNIVRERLGDRVTDLVFDRKTMRSPYLSVPHVRAFFEKFVGPVQRVVGMLEPEKLAAFRREFDALVSEYFEPDENILRQDYLQTRAKKK